MLSVQVEWRRWADRKGTTVGSFKCRCGYRLGASPPERGTGFHAVPDEVYEEGLFSAEASDRFALADDFHSLFRCPNRGRLHWETRDPSGRIDVYVRETSYPRVWADLACRDEMGRVVLIHERSLADMRRRKSRDLAR